MYYVESPAISSIIDVMKMTVWGESRFPARFLGGDWARIQPLAHSVRNAIEQHRPRLTAGDIKDKVDTILESVPRTKELPRAKRSEIEAIFREVSQWDAVKRAGDAAIPRGQPTQQFQDLQTLCKEIGLWIVPVGELEGFCKSVSGKGPAWVQQVVEHRKLEDAPELESARKFVREMWMARNSDGNPDSPQAIVSLTSIVDVTVGT